MTTPEQLLPPSVEMRALDYMAKGMDAIEAVKKSLQHEINLCWISAHGVDMETGRYQKEMMQDIQKMMCEKVYNRINNK